MKSRIILVGPTCAGKNHMRNLFVNRGYTHDVSYTTREPRVELGEFDGIDYHFISEEKFKKMIDQNKFYEWVKYGDVYYGTGLNEWKTKDVFIMETQGIRHIKPEDRGNCFIIFINPPVETRINRMKNIRGWGNEKINNRLEIDQENFGNFLEYDMLITDPNF